MRNNLRLELDSRIGILLSQIVNYILITREQKRNMFETKIIWNYENVFLLLVKIINK